MAPINKYKLKYFINSNNNTYFFKLGSFNLTYNIKYELINKYYPDSFESMIKAILDTLMNENDDNSDRLYKKDCRIYVNINFHSLQKYKYKYIEILSELLEKLIQW